MELFDYLMAKKGHNTGGDLFSYLLGKNAGGSDTYTTFSGTSLNISNTLQAKIKNIALEGNTSQETTTGKNLFNVDNDSKSWGGTKWEFTNGILTIDGEGEANTLVGNKLMNINIPADTTITISMNYISGTLTGGSIQLGFKFVYDDETTYDLYTSNQTDIFKPDNYLTKKTISRTLTLSKNVVGIYLHPYISYCTCVNFTGTVQLEEGSTATEYEPYTGGQPSPNPDYPQPIKVVTGEQNVKISGKNLFDKDNDVTLKTQATFNGKEDNEFTTSSSNIRTLIIIKVPSNSEITLSINNDNYIQSRYFICQLKTPTIEAGKNERWYTGNSTIVTTDKTNYLGIVLEIKKNGTAVNSTQESIDEMNIKIEEGTIVTSYVPYQSQPYPLSLGNIELAKIGDYKDYIFKNVVGSPYYNADLELNEWYLHKEITKVILTKNSYWYYRDVTIGGETRRVFFSRYDVLKSYNSMRNMMCNYFKVKNTEGTSPTADNQFYNNYGRTNNLEFTKFDITTLNEWKEWVSTHNIILVGKRVNPTDTKITDTTLIGQLENLNNARSYKGTTIIECTSESADNETIVFSGDIKVTSVGLGNPLNTSLLSSNIQEETNIDDIQEEPNLDEIEDIEQNDEPIENEEPIEEPIEEHEEL